MLEIANLQVLYDGVVEGVRDVSLKVGQRQIVALLGSNGAGKSTTLKALSGVLYAEDGAVSKGAISFENRDLLNLASHKIVELGLVQVPEGRRLFDTMTVNENLIAGGVSRPRSDTARALDHVFHLFPEIVLHQKRIAGFLSGGQQQMVAIGRALMSRPRLLVLDEPSLGLAPQIIKSIFDVIRRLRDESGVRRRK